MFVLKKKMYKSTKIIKIPFQMVFEGLQDVSCADQSVYKEQNSSVIS